MVKSFCHMLWQPPVMDGRKGSSTVSTTCTYDGAETPPQADRSPCSTAASLPLPSSCRCNNSLGDQDVQGDQAPTERGCQLLSLQF